MTEHNAGTPEEAHARPGEPQALEDLRLDDEAAEEVVGGDTAETASQFRGRYQLRLHKAGSSK